MKKKFAAFTAIAVCATVALSASGCAKPVIGDVQSAAEPVILAQPADLNLRLGEETQGLEITAYSPDNGALSYQWYGSETDANSGGTAISGADKSVLTVDTATAGTSFYYCVVTNTNGLVAGEKTAVKTSAAATVTVSYSAETPRITAQPKSVSYVLGTYGTALPLSVEASVVKGDLSYQWYVSDDGSYELSTAIEGATRSDYVPSIASRGSHFYFCEVTNTDAAATDGAVSSVKTKMANVSVDYDYAAFAFEEIDDETCKLVSYSGSALYPVIPETDDGGRAVVEIGIGVFANSPILELTVPDTVTTLGSATTSAETDGVFCDCSSLRKINFGGKFKFIGEFTFVRCASLSSDFWNYCDQAETICNGAFQYVNLPETMVMPADITSIGSWTFQNSNGVKHITFAGNNVTSIGGSAFAGISTLETIVFPASVTSVGDCLKQCPGLKSVTFERSKDAEGSITSGSPFSGSDYSADMKIYVHDDGSYEAYRSSLSAYADRIVKLPPVEYTLTVEGATINGENSLLMYGGTALEAGATVEYVNDNCLGWLVGDAYYSDYADLAANFKMKYSDATVKAVYADDFTQVFTPSCRTEVKVGTGVGTKTTQTHVDVGGIKATRIVYNEKNYIKILNGPSNEKHGTADGVYNDCPVNPKYKTCILMTFTNNSDEAIEIRYEAEYYGVIGSVTVSLAAHETKTALLVETCLSDKSADTTAFHQLEILSGGDNGYDLTIYGMRAV